MSRRKKNWAGAAPEGMKGHRVEIGCSRRGDHDFILLTSRTVYPEYRGPGSRMVSKNRGPKAHPRENIYVDQDTENSTFYCPDPRCARKPVRLRNKNLERLAVGIAVANDEAGASVPLDVSWADATITSNSNLAPPGVENWCDP